MMSHPGERRLVSLQAASGVIPFDSLDELISQSSLMHGERECLRDDHGRSVSFNEFDEASGRVRQHLRNLGLVAGDTVALFLENSVTWPILWAGIVRAGCVSVPINSSYQVSDLSFVLADSASKMVVADDSLIPIVKSASADCPELLYIKTAENFEADVNTNGVGVGSVGPDSVANFQYTSGTTGFPKGCVLTHKYWLRSGLLSAAYFNLSDDDVVVTAQKLSYLDPMWLTTMCLAAGATLVILDRFSASDFWPAVRRHGVTTFYVLGTMPALLLKQPVSEGDRDHSVRLVLCSGIPAELHSNLEDRWGAPWREVYGMTETGMDLAVPEGAVGTVGTGAVGKPVPTKQIRILDESGCSVAAGQRGELLVKGEPMMLRYHNRPGDTDKTIVDGWLHTGDIVYQDPDGWVHIVGRIKDMIRRGGENVAAAEVEDTVELHSSVLACAVTAVPDDVFGEEVKAYVQLKPECVPSEELAEGILAFVLGRLARFKVPRFLEFVEEFPLTPSERISKAELLKTRPDQKSGSFDRVGRASL